MAHVLRSATACEARRGENGDASHTRAGRAAATLQASSTSSHVADSFTLSDSERQEEGTPNRRYLNSLVVEAVAWRYAEPDDQCPATHKAQPPSDVRFWNPAPLRTVLAFAGLMAEREDRCLDAVLQAEFGKDAADVRLDGLFADRQVPGDLPVALAAGDQLEHFAFAW